jgi:hypothetical protein
MNWCSQKRSLREKPIKLRVKRAQVNSEMVDISAIRHDY